PSSRSIDDNWCLESVCCRRDAPCRTLACKSRYRDAFYDLRAELNCFASECLRRSKRVCGAVATGNDPAGTAVGYSGDELFQLDAIDQFLMGEAHCPQFVHASAEAFE